jgi:hypothetical protein
LGLSQAEECFPLGNKGFICNKLRVLEGLRWERKKGPGGSAFFSPVLPEIPAPSQMRMGMMM